VSKPKPQIPKRAAAADRVLELDRQHCRWPVGEPTSPDFRFCTRPEADFPARPYCNTHTHKAFNRQQGSLKQSLAD
jgi:GcrA cell cycle regulator